jgi:hypothetical protein
MDQSDSRPSSVLVPEDLPPFKYLSRSKRTGKTLKKYRGRGKAFVEQAIAFAHHFPLDEERHIEEFDTWAHACGYYAYPKDAHKNSDAWKAMLRRRDELLNGINTAAETEDMEARDVRAFYVLRRYNKFRRILPSTHAAHTPVNMDKVFSQAVRIRKQLQDALNAQWFDSMPETWQDYAASLYIEMETFEKEIEVKVQGEQRKLQQLVKRIERDVQRNLIDPNHPIMRGLRATNLLPPGPTGADAPDQPPPSPQTSQDAVACEEDESYC